MSKITESYQSDRVGYIIDSTWIELNNEKMGN